MFNNIFLEHRVTMLSNKSKTSNPSHRYSKIRLFIHIYLHKVHLLFLLYTGCPTKHEARVECRFDLW